MDIYIIVFLGQNYLFLFVFAAGQKACRNFMLARVWLLSEGRFKGMEKIFSFYSWSQGGKIYKLHHSICKLLKVKF